MAIREELEKYGNWFFRWRSYLPLLILPILLIALRNSEYLEQHAGDLADHIWEGFCIAISFLGLAVRCLTVGYVPKATYGRNTKEQRASTLNMTGMYSIVRHPLYLGNFIIFLGMTLFVEVWWFTLIAILAFWLYYERIIFAEEEFLRKKYGALFLEWSARTPTFLPKFKNWQQPTLLFSFRNVLKREYSSFFGIIASFAFLEIAGDIFAEGKLELDLAWAILFIIGLIVYLTLRILKRKTKILDVEGR
jgi:protein-S-isoprenylcysteine O-methyltransferase Ste14